GPAINVQGAANDLGISTEAMIPVVPGNYRIRTGAGSLIILGDEQTAERGLKAEEREHVGRDINDVCLLHIVIGGPCDVRAVGIADGDEVSAVLDSVAHDFKIRRRPIAVLHRPALRPDQLAREDVKPAGSGNGQRSPEQCVDETEGGDTGPNPESE